MTDNTAATMLYKILTPEQWASLPAEGDAAAQPWAGAGIDVSERPAWGRPMRMQMLTAAAPAHPPLTPPPAQRRLHPPLHRPAAPGHALPLLCLPLSFAHTRALERQASATSDVRLQLAGHHRRSPQRPGRQVEVGERLPALLRRGARPAGGVKRAAYRAEGCREWGLCVARPDILKRECIP